MAIVTISAVNEGNLFAHANNAVTKWNDETAKENVLISNYIADMEKYAQKSNGVSSGLVYNKAYAGTMAEKFFPGLDTATFEYYFLPNYDKVIWIDYMVGLENPGAILISTYSYDESANKITINGDSNYNLSEDGQKITINEEELNLTSKEFPYSLYRIAEKNSDTNVDLYNGIYYNKELNKMIIIYEDCACSYENDIEDLFITSSDQLESQLNERYGITIKDNRTLVKDENEYILLESL